MLNVYSDRACVRPTWFSTTKGKYPFTLATPFKRGASGALWLPESHKAFLEQNRGANRVINGGFDTDSNWSKAGSWSISGGTASVAATGVENLTQGSVVEVGKWYVVSFTISNYSAGSLRCLVGSGSATGYVSANGPYSFIMKAAGNTLLYFQTSSTGTMDVDDVLVEELPPGAQDAILYQDSAGTTPVTADGDPIGLFLETSKWGGKTLSEYLAGQPNLWDGVGVTIGTGWTDNGDETYTRTNVSAYTAVQDDGVIENNKWFAVEYEVSGASGGGVRVRFNGNIYFGNYNGDGTHTVFGRAPSTGTAGRVELMGELNFAGTVEIVSVKEVEGDHDYQTTDANRRTFRIAANGNYFTEYNGSNHSDVADFSSGAGSSDCSVFVALKTTDPAFVLFRAQITSNYAIVIQDSSGSAVLTQNAGSPEIFVCDVGAGEAVLTEFTGTTRDDLHTTLADGEWKIVELRGADLSTWTQFGVSTFSTWEFLGSIGGAVQIVESGPILEASRAKIVTEMIELLP